MLRYVVLFLSIYCLTKTSSSLSPVVIAPPILRTNAQNVILITPKSANSSVDITLRITFYNKDGNTERTRTAAASRTPGYAHHLTFTVPENAREAAILISVTNHEDSSLRLLVAPDVRNIHLKTDKGFYKAGEKVKLIAVPLTGNGDVYTGEIEYVLQTPGGFEITRHKMVANHEPVVLFFELPTHLYYGQWKIKAKPSNAPNSPLLQFETNFEVSEYVLPPFFVDFRILDDNHIEATRLSVQARYFHGELMARGAVRLTCSPDTEKASAIAQMPIIVRHSNTPLRFGQWHDTVNLRECFYNINRTVLTAVVMDDGTSKKSEAKITHDPRQPGFQIVPLRPGFTYDTKKLYFAGFQDPHHSTSEGVLDLHCMSARPENYTYDIRVGDTKIIDMPNKWNIECDVIEVKWSRGRDSRSRSLMLPMLSNKSALEQTLHFSMLQPLNYTTLFSAGEIVAFSAKLDGSFNYMVICNGRDVVSSEKSNFQIISFVAQRSMTGSCVLYAYSIHKKKYDVFLFFVKDRCPATVSSSLSEIRPNQTLTVTMRGAPNGYSVLRALDEKIALLMTDEQPLFTKVWEGLFFSRAVEEERQVQIHNLINRSDIYSIITLNCENAGLRINRNRCPEQKASISAVSNLCLKSVAESCAKFPTMPSQPQSQCDNANSCPRPEIKAAAIPIRSRTRTNVLNADVNEPVELPPDDVVFTRSYFPHVWMFEFYALEKPGIASQTLSAPHSVGSWLLQADFWGPGQTSFCAANPKRILSKKDFFLEIDIPKIVYVNETVDVRVSVIGSNIVEHTPVQICMPSMPRELCTNENSNQKKLVLDRNSPTARTTFRVKFFHTGKVTTTFDLRIYKALPGGRCGGGTKLDSVQHELMIAKRAETEEYYRRLILSVQKPVSQPLNDAVSNADTIDGISTIFSVSESRSSSDTLITSVDLTLPESDKIYSAAIEIARFLPTRSSPEFDNELLDEISTRTKRGILEHSNAYLMDVLKKLSVQLYEFKLLKNVPGNERTETMQLENGIGSLVVEMLRFSDCAGGSKLCGYSEFPNPKGSEQRSPVLTAIATTLLCEAVVDENIVCGSLRYLHQVMKRKFPPNELIGRLDMHGMADMDHEHSVWFLRALLNHISLDCATYSCIRDDSAWLQLYNYLYQLDESTLTDSRTIAALAYMGTNATNNVLRQRLKTQVREHQFPYWSAGFHSNTRNDKLQGTNTDIFFNYKSIKSGEVLVNALGILAFVGRSVRVPSGLDFDVLADWLFEQKKEDGTYENALDTYFATRALYEYRTQKIEIDPINGIAIELSTYEPHSQHSSITRQIQLSDLPVLIYIPTSTRKIEFSTTGFGKTKAGIRLLADKRQRSRRQAGRNNFPVQIKVNQLKTRLNQIMQRVCLEAVSPLIRTAEIIHGIYTGFQTSTDKLNFLPNSLTLIDSPQITSNAVHLLIFFNQSTSFCYELALIPPDSTHEPALLAPVEISARHPVNGIIGRALIYHPDATSAAFRRRRNRRYSHHHVPKPKRAALYAYNDDTIATVCIREGECMCAESTKTVRCNTASNKRLPKKTTPDTFTLITKFTEQREERVGSIEYLVYRLNIFHQEGHIKYGNTTISLQNVTFYLWLNKGNSCASSIKVDENTAYSIVGNVREIYFDEKTRANYILRLDDRLELYRFYN